MKSPDVWVVSATSESSDDYGPWVFNWEPTEDALEVFLKQKAPREWPEDGDRPGPCFRGSYLHVDVSGPLQVITKIAR